MTVKWMVKGQKSSCGTAQSCVGGPKIYTDTQISIKVPEKTQGNMDCGCLWGGGPEAWPLNLASSTAFISLP